MVRPRLAPCPGCTRHLRVSESVCPFCGVAIVPGTLVGRSQPRITQNSLGRAAIFAFGSAIASTAPGCYLSHERSAPSDRTVVDAHTHDAGPIFAGTREASVADASVPDDAAEDIDAFGPIGLLYGGPSPIEPIDAGSPEDAFGGGQALYGAPPP